jgi:FkbM family methyltransferase
MISYAQNREDVVLGRAFPRPNGFYVDVGAAHPVYHSVTKWFYERGWYGINVEPHPTFFEMIVGDRPRDVNLNVAASDAEGEVPYHEMPDLMGCSTLNPEWAELHRASGTRVVTRQVTTLTLGQIFERHVEGRTVDFLKIDAEVHEEAVLAGMDFTRWRPRVILVEATPPCEWEKLILPHDYLHAFYDGLNRYYVRAEDRELIPTLAVPANVRDDFVPYEYECQILGLEAALAEARAGGSAPPVGPEDVVSRRAYDSLLSLFRTTRDQLDALRRATINGRAA